MPLFQSETQYVNVFILHLNENSFSHERLGTKTRFEKDPQDNSEIGYWTYFSVGLSGRGNGPGGGGVFRISSDGDDRMGAKIKTQKNP